jgi:hypothetical protein
MGKSAKREYFKAIRGQYQETDRRTKTIILDGFFRYVPIITGQSGICYPLAQ